MFCIDSEVFQNLMEISQQAGKSRNWTQTDSETQKLQHRYFAEW